MFNSEAPATVPATWEVAAADRRLSGQILSILHRVTSSTRQWKAVENHLALVTQCVNPASLREPPAGLTVLALLPYRCQGGCGRARPGRSMVGPALTPAGCFCLETRIGAGWSTAGCHGIVPSRVRDVMPPSRSNSPREHGKAMTGIVTITRRSSSRRRCRPDRTVRRVGQPWRPGVTRSLPAGKRRSAICSWSGCGPRAPASTIPNRLGRVATFGSPESERVRHRGGHRRRLPQDT
jgi:hypothetical protein